MKSNYSPVYDPTVPRSVSGVFPVHFVEAAMLHDDGVTISGWVPTPDAPWQPDDLLWTPPGVKSGPDVFGEVVDVVPRAAFAWVTTQLAKRQRYLDSLRDLVAAGRLRLTPALAKMLGLAGDGVELLDRSGSLAPARDPVQEEVAAELARFRLMDEHGIH